ncbi:MAG: efflux RND transporter periplasmic adaptor subunit [Pseudomonadota bacterium]|nr:efflux RND transporter periplasmic adaptor subunit [Pseudomonadota bacterium]MEC8485129.1 efflux RND transporter periplasmic adaptor subunit [Pseudomonadota bacterium]
MAILRFILKCVLWSITLGSPIFAGWWLYQDSQSASVSWLTDTVKTGSIEITVPATGTLEPSNYVDVGAQVSGQIKTLHVSEGDVVKKGQLLAEIDATVFETEVKRSRASLLSQKAQRDQLVAQLELAESQLERDRRLNARGAVSDDSLKQSETDIVVQRAKLAATEAELQVDEAALEQDLITLSYSQIYAPMDGTITSVEVRVGQTLNASQSAPTLMTISDLSHMTLRANVSEADIQRLSPDMPVRFSTLGNPNDFFYSSLEKVLPTPLVNNDVVLYQVLIKVDNEAGRLMDGMSTQVFFIEAQAKDVLTIPLAAISERPRGTVAYIPGPDIGSRATTPVKIGLKNRTQVEIVSGLGLNDSVIVGRENGASSEKSISLTGSSSSRGPMGGRRGF